MVKENTLANSAAKAGLILGAVSIVGLLLPWQLDMLSGSGLGANLGVKLVKFLIWIAKLVLCIWLMRFFMLKFSANAPEADNSRVFRFGMLTALLSSVVYSAFYMAYLQFLNPEKITESLEALQGNPAFDSSKLDLMEEFVPLIRNVTFFINLIYCFIYGTIVSAILSRNIPPRNPFPNNGE